MEITVRDAGAATIVAVRTSRRARDAEAKPEAVVTPILIL